MRLFGDSILGGTIAWRTFRLKPRLAAVPTPNLPPANAEPVEFDEQGRRYVFRFRAAALPEYTVDRDRIFEYVRSKRLPSAADRALRRDVRNSVNFFEDVRDLQTHGDIESL